MKLKPQIAQGSAKKSPSLKSLYITFTGIYIPLLGIIFTILFSKRSALTPEFVLLTTLTFTVFASIVAFALGKKLHPVED